MSERARAPASEAPQAPDRELAAEVASNPLWYHTLELAPGVVTAGWFDLRPIVERIPWPDVRGKRCLDVGTYDGFLAFELERRGASEVVATDLASHELWDWPPEARASGPEFVAAAAGDSEKRRGFELAKRALGSSVERHEGSVYELTTDQLGDFDVVVCGALLLHLRDPIRALDAMRLMIRPGGELLSKEQFDLRLTLTNRRTPLTTLKGRDVQWWVPNVAGLHRMLHVGGFAVEQSSRFAEPMGSGHPGRLKPAERLVQRLTLGGCGVPTAALRARPRL